MLQRESLFQSPKGVNDLQVRKEEQPIQLKDLFGTSWHVPSVLGVGQQKSRSAWLLVIRSGIFICRKTVAMSGSVTTPLLR